MNRILEFLLTPIHNLKANLEMNKVIREAFWDSDIGRAFRQEAEWRARYGNNYDLDKVLLLEAERRKHAKTKSL